MAVNQTSTNSNACEKIFRAIRRGSKCPLSYKVTSSAPIDQKKATNEAISTEVPVIFNTPRSPDPSKLKADTSVKKNGQVVKLSSPNQPVKTEVAFSNENAYTRLAEPEKAKPMVDTTPTRKAVVGSGQDKGQQDLVKGKGVQLKEENGNGSDKFSGYIDRAEAEIRTMPGIGVGSGNGGGGGSKGKSLSRRDSFNDRVSDYIRRAKLKIRAPSNVVDR